eukprot:1698506-Prymnesium_polylepis.1
MTSCAPRNRSRCSSCHATNALLSSRIAATAAAASSCTASSACVPSARAVHSSTAWRSACDSSCSRNSSTCHARTPTVRGELRARP